MNLPNRLTLVRIALSFLMVFLLLRPGLAFKEAALCVFVAAALTDWWDGRIARRRGLVSNFGILMDPIADKVLVLFSFGAFVWLGVAPLWLVLLIAAREILITGLRMTALAKGQALPAEAAGKVKVAFQMVTISLTLLYLIALEAWPASAGAPGWHWAEGWASLLWALMFLTLLLTLTSGFSFLWHNRKLDLPLMRTIATVGGIGRVPRLPGTVASVVGAGISWLLSSDPTAQIAGCLAAAALGFWSAGPAAKALGEKDPSVVVIDEVAGMMLGLALLPATWGIYLAGLLLFRFLDIFKPGPIRRLERLPGSAGIMADDLLAGILTNLLLRLVLLVR